MGIRVETGRRVKANFDKKKILIPGRDPGASKQSIPRLTHKNDEELRQPNIFRGLSSAERDTVLRYGSPRRFRRKQLVFAQGDPHGAVFIIESGIVRTYYTSPTGREITLAYWQKGNLVGTPQVLGTGAYQWSGSAIAPTETLEFHSNDLRQLMEQIPSIAIGIIEALEFKGRCLSNAIHMLGTMTVIERVIQLLLSLQDLYGVQSEEGVILGRPFTHEAIASMVGASRQWVTTMLHQLKEYGVIRIGKRHMIILRPDLLASTKLIENLANFPTPSKKWR